MNFANYQKSSFSDLLRQYYSVYYLKPYDAVNDAANAYSFQGFPWKSPACEIGTGDGLFSFVMHGGRLPIAEDRYNQCNPGQSGDIYNHYDPDAKPKLANPAHFGYALGVDGNDFHLRKCRDFDLYEKLLRCPSEDLAEVPAESFNTVFFYVYHGLQDYEASVKEAHRILKPGGTLNILTYADRIRTHFPCYEYGEQLPGEQGRYFKRLDGGRYVELAAGYSRSLQQWKTLFTQIGFEIRQIMTQVDPVAWTFYDVQTRPFLKSLIEFDKHLAKEELKVSLKAKFIECTFAPLLEFAELFAKPRTLPLTGNPQTDVFLSFSLEK